MFALDLQGPINQSTAAQLSDQVGHRTHVAGCALANGVESLMLGPTGLVGGKICGPASQANFVITNRKGDTSGEPYAGNVIKIFDRAYQRGARVSNQSFGYNISQITPIVLPQAVQYRPKNTELDDYLLANPDLVATYAASNSGDQRAVYPFQISGFACSKNVITVGASLSSRRATVVNGVPTYDTTAVEQNPFQVASFSSIGPCTVSTAPALKVRQKPDLCAPEIVILSSLSGLVQDDRTFGTSGDQGYRFAVGTSQAAPHVAGCATVLRQALRLRLNPNPTAALI